ncbi:MAG: hypothetical protein PF508_20005 [Spirochaeta sp.]|jgi:hypothetical protein|nr:hypothetical protein [Spirochaeta sp.]
MVRTVRTILTDLAAVCAAEELDRYATTELSAYASLRQLGAQQVVCGYLEGTGDLARTVALVEQTGHRRPGFSLTTLLSVLCNRCITVPFAERSSYNDNFLKRNHDESETEREIRKLQGREDIGVYVPPLEVLETFAAAQPEMRELFAATITTHGSDCRGR